MRTNPDLFVHVADLHLAPRAGSVLKVDKESGRLQRDVDRDEAFVMAVDDTLAQEPLPSAFVIAGDIFDTYKGSADAFITVVTQLRRLIDAGIHVVGIAGNHDTPTNAMKTPMFVMLRNVFSGDDGMVDLAYDDVEHVCVGNTEFVLLPHKCCIEGTFSEESLLPTSDLPHKVLVVHGVAAGDPSLKQMDEAKEVPIARWTMDMGWDYVAFGHFHRPGWIPGYEGRAAYCGSLENTVISGPDVCMERGPVFVDMSESGLDLFDMHPQPVRGIVELQKLDLSGKDMNADELDAAIAKRISDNPEHGAIVRLTVSGITRALYKSLPRRNFQSCDDTALLVKVSFEFADDVFQAPQPSDDDADDATKDESQQQGLLPLEKETELAIDSLVSSGGISAARRDAVADVVRAALGA